MIIYYITICIIICISEFSEFLYFCVKIIRCKDIWSYLAITRHIVSLWAVFAHFRAYLVL